jgi:hypothetical protein
MNDQDYGLFTIHAPTIIPTKKGEMWSVDIAVGDLVVMSCLAPVADPDGDEKATQAAKEWLLESLIISLDALDPERKKRGEIAFETSWNESKKRIQS